MVCNSYCIQVPDSQILLFHLFDPRLQSHKRECVHSRHHQSILTHMLQGCMDISKEATKSNFNPFGIELLYV